MSDASVGLRLHDLLARHAAARPGALAIGDGEVKLSWREFADRVERCAAALAVEGVGHGDRVLWLGQNSFRVQELLLACSRLGAAFCAANWRQTASELAFVIDDLTPAVVFTQIEEIGGAVAEGLATATHQPAAVVEHDGDGDGDGDGGGDGDGEDGYESWLARRSRPSDLDDAAVTEDDAVLFVYTAAFDGRPNAAMLPHRAIVAQARVMGPWMGVHADHCYLNAGPLFHIGVLMENFATLCAGGANVFVRRSDGDDLCRAIERFRCTSGYILGPMVDAIVAANRDDQYDLSSLHGRRGHPDYDRRVQSDDSEWGRRPGGYGQTETMGMQTFNLLAPPDAMGTHGVASPLVQLRIVDPDDREVVPGEVGEITVRGPTVMLGYWNRPELNARRSRGGWHHTNDLGRIETDGSFSFIAPKGRMLKSAAENIYPAEVEQALRAHPDVTDAAIIGVPDPTWVQGVKAIVVLREGATTSADELIEHCRATIASYKKPRSVEFVDALPRTGFAVDYAALDAQFGGGNYPGGTTPST